MSAAHSKRARVFGVLMTRNEQDVLRLNLLHHLNNHCERIIVVDNGSSDATPRILRRLSRRLPITWTTDPGRVRQDEIVTAMAREARKAGAEWVIPLDTDEFWHSGRHIWDVLGDTPDAGAVEAPRIEFVQTRGQLQSTPRGVLNATMRVEHPLLGAEPRSEFLAGERSMFEVAPDPKLIVRMNADTSIRRGAHKADGLDGPVVVSDQIAVFHVPLRSRAALEKRAEQGRRIAEVSDDTGIAFQSRYWEMMRSQNRLDEGWLAHSYEAGALDVNGREVELVEDGRLAEILSPLVRGAASQTLARLAGAP